MCYSINSKYKHRAFKDILELVINSKQSNSKRFIYIDANAGPGLGIYKRGIYTEDDSIVSSCFEVINKLAQREINSECYLIDNDKRVIKYLHNSVKKFFSNYNLLYSMEEEKYKLYTNGGNSVIINIIQGKNTQVINELTKK